MNRTTSPMASAFLAAASCLWGGETNAQAPLPSALPQATQVFWLQFADGTLSQYEVSGEARLKEGDALWVPYGGGTRLGMVRTNLGAAQLNSLVLPPLLPRIEVLPPPRMYREGVDQLVLPPQPAAAPVSLGTMTPERLKGQIRYSGPEDLREAILNSAVQAQLFVARSWFGRIPYVPPLNLKVEVTTDKVDGTARFESRPDKPVDISVSVIGKESDLVRIVWHEFAHVVAHCSLGEGIPRWFDEGVATSTEPKEWQEHFQTILMKAVFTEGKDIPLTDLFMRSAAPAKEEAALFYGKSLRTVRYLVERSPGFSEDEKKQYVAAFIREVIAAGGTLSAYDAALHRFFRIKSVSELDLDLRASMRSSLPR